MVSYYTEYIFPFITTMFIFYQNDEVATCDLSPSQCNTVKGQSPRRKQYSKIFP
jgi:hypothetical protein